MCKKIVAIMLLALMIAGLAPAPGAQAAQIKASDLYADSCILIDALTGEVLFEKDADTRRSPASTTKIMTLLLAIELTDPHEIVTIPKCVEDIGLNSTRVPVYYGERMPMMDLWYGLIYKSGNDAANAIGELAAGSLDAFVKKMNDKAQQLGMTKTSFANAHGYTQSGHYTTARDMAALTRAALDVDIFREVTFSQTYTMQPTALRPELPITHKYAICDNTTIYYYKYARGIKTGYTAAAGQCFVGAAIKGGRELIAVILHCGGTKPEKWVDAKALFEYGFAALEAR